MKKSFFILLLFFCSLSYGQSSPGIDTLHETAQAFLRQGDYENAILVLNRTLQMRPDDLQMTKDLLFAYYLKRDFVKAMEIGKPLVEREDADVQSFQMLGLVYRAIAEDKEAEKLYIKALKKFPNQGILYSDYGELQSAKDMGKAMKTWEKGIEADPNYSGNYYFAVRQYAQDGNIVWSILYGEMFLNMESFTARSTEIKNLLLEQYKKFFISGQASAAGSGKTPEAFTVAVTEVLNKQQNQANMGITPETLTIIRTRFILDWYDKYAATFPFRLFEHQRQLLQDGMFEAYNFWLFGPAASLRTYQTWQQFHQKDLDTFLTFIRSKVFKIPEGQQYHAM